MVQQIQVGNDILEFPDNMPDEQITAVIKKEYPQNGQQTQTTQPEISGQPDEGFQARNQRVVSQVAMGVPQGLGNAAIGAFQAATDVGEKAANLIERLYYGDNLNMNTFGDRLAEQVKLRNEQQAQLPAAERVGIAIGQSLPYLTTGVGTGAKVAQVAGKVAGLAAGGAVGGAVSSALSPQEEAGLENRAIETVKGAVIGGSIGGGLGVVGKTIGIGKSLFTAKSAEDILAAKLPKEQTAALLKQLKVASPDNPVIIPDIAGDSIKGLTRSVAKISSAKDIVVDALENRSQAAISRVSNYLSKDISPVNAYFGNIDDLIKARSEISQPLYERAYAEGNINIQKLLKPQIVTKNEFVSNGMGGVKEQITKTEIPVDPLFSNPNILKYISKAKNEPLFVDPRISNNDFAVLDGAKKMIDDDIGSAMRAGENERARALVGIKNQIVNKLEEVSPSYKQARQVFGGFSQLKKAQETGLNFSRFSPEEISKEIKSLSVAERDAYRIGVRENLQKTVSSTADGADPAKRIFGNKTKRDQLRVVFGNRKKFTEFEQKMVNEIKAADTKAKVLGGSRTDYNMAGDEEFLNKVITGGINLAKSKVNPFYILEATNNAITNKFSGINEKNASNLARILVSRPDAIDALENIIRKERNLLQQRILIDVKNYILTNTLTQSINQ